MRVDTQKNGQFLPSFGLRNYTSLRGISDSFDPSFCAVFTYFWRHISCSDDRLLA